MCQAEKAFVFEQPYRKRVGSVETDVCHSYLSNYGNIVLYYSLACKSISSGEGDFVFY